MRAGVLAISACIRQCVVAHVRLCVTARIGPKVMTAQPLMALTGDSAVAAGGCTRFHWLRAAVKTAALVSGNWPLRPDPAPLGWTCFPRIATRTPGLDGPAVGEARDFAIATVRRWGAAQRCDDVAVVVSELLTNALRHALPGPGESSPRWPIRLGLLHPGPCVLCVVADPSKRLPVPREPGILSENGRGLHVIGALSDDWGYAVLGDFGKVVWAMFSTAVPLDRARFGVSHRGGYPAD